MKPGDRVYIADNSDAHGDAGTIYHIQEDGLIIVDLGECLWPVFSESDLRVVESDALVRALEEAL